MEISKGSGQSADVSRSLRQVMQQHPLFFFFLMAYAFSWIVFIPYVLSEWGILQGDFTLFYVIHTFGPALAAIAMTAIIAGRSGLHDFRQRIRQWHASWQWYLFILLGIPALVMFGVIVQPRALASFKGLQPILLVRYLVLYVATFFGGGPLGEEPGWRGFALPRMQPRYGPLWGTLFLGVLWNCWHLPDFLTASKGGGISTGWATFLTNFPIFTLAVVSLAGHHDLDLQPHPGKHFHCHSGACQRQYTRSKWFDSTLSSREHDRHSPGPLHGLWGDSAADCHPDAWPAWLRANPGDSP
jgi:membrane protease YdiL (CAAX protease family)